MHLDSYTILMIAIFLIGYAAIIMEHALHINKSAAALVAGVLVWVAYAFMPSVSHEQLMHHLTEFVSSDSQIIFFLLGALTLVELIQLHRGFAIVTQFLRVSDKRVFFFLITLISFFLSAVIDNLTTTVVMISLLQNLVQDKRDRWLMGGGVVVAANAGGAWTPIGDVTTTMLWIDHKITAIQVMKDLLIPSLMCWLVATFAIMPALKGKLNLASQNQDKPEPFGNQVFMASAAVLVLVPVFKTVTGLPPFMGVILGLGIVWMLTDWLHHAQEGRQHLLIPVAFSKIDTSSILFFLGILLCVNALEAAHILQSLALWLNQHVYDSSLIAILIGLLSAVVDNVPLVAASMGMYDLTAYPTDSSFWQLIAYCAGTGGSILIIGSAAGVVFMGLEKVSFGWFLRHISFPAALGYFAGVGAYFVFHLL